MRWGLGIPLEEIDMSMNLIVYHYFLDLWADMWLYTFSVGLSKFVILGFYWRMFSLSVIRQPIRILMACSAAWIIARVSYLVRAGTQRLIAQGRSDSAAVPAYPQILAQRCCRQVPIDTYDVSVRCGHTSFRS